MGFSCVRGDDIWEHHTIIQDVVNIIARAKVVICDCSGKNPNVFYEAGIAHAIGKEVILIAQSEQNIPFDLRHLRYIPYLPNSEGLGELSSSLQKKCAHSEAGKNCSHQCAGKDLLVRHLVLSKERLPDNESLPAMIRRGGAVESTRCLTNYKVLT